jgi:serine/threonine-protein kinase
MAPQEGRLAGRYELIEPIGTGSLGVVWHARDAALGRSVAVRIVRRQLREDRDVVRRVLDAMRRASRLAHPGVVPVHEAGVDGDTLFVATELVDGSTLADVMARTRPLPPIFALEIAAAAADALAAAHRRRLVHGDVRPANLFLGRDGRVRLADFGLATAVAGTQGEDRPTATDDVAALGSVLFEMFKGRPPGHSEQAGEIATALRDESVGPAAALGQYLPEGVDSLLRAAVGRDGGRRFQSARAFRDALTSAAHGLRAGLEHPEASFETQVVLAATRPGLLAVHPAVLDRAASIGIPPAVRTGDAAVTPQSSGARPHEPALPASVAAPPRTGGSEVRPPIEPPGEPERRLRKRRRQLVLTATLLVLLALVAVAPSLTGAGRSGGVLAATATPPLAMGSADTQPSGTPEPFRPESPSTTLPGSRPTPPPAPPPTPPPTVPPPTAPPASATPRPAPATAPQPRLAAPSAAVASFYDAVESHDWDRAIAAWSPDMQARYPPDEWLIGRFRSTTRIDISRLRLIASETADTATVAVTLVEYRTVEPSPRTFVGDWDLILVDGRWLLHDPDF